MSQCCDGDVRLVHTTNNNPAGFGNHDSYKSGLWDL